MRSFRLCLTMYSVVTVKYLLNLLNYRFSFLLLHNKTLKIYRLKITTITFVHNSVGIWADVLVVSAGVPYTAAVTW